MRNFFKTPYRFHAIFIFLFSILFYTTARAQNDKPFWNEIEAFKKSDSINPPSQNAILFVGSSSFRGWRDVQAYFPNRTIINRGFGGSSLPHVTAYANDIIFPYKPKQIVIYCGENDLAAPDAPNAAEVANRFKTLLSAIRKHQPKVPVVFVSIKPSPSRAALMPTMVATNALIKQFLKKEKRTTYVDVYYKMLRADGSPMPELFLGDQLHMNAKGYAIWKQALEPVLLK